MGDKAERRVPQTEPARSSMPVPSEGTSEQRASQQKQLAEPSTLIPGDPGFVWVRSTPSQVVRTVAIALLTAASVRAGTNFHRLVRHRALWRSPQPALDSSTGNMGFRCVKEV